jgi:hypothetical protein
MVPRREIDASVALFEPKERRHLLRDAGAEERDRNACTPVRCPVKCLVDLNRHRDLAER